MSPLSTGKVRRLQQCATGRGVFSILAIDHRNSLRRALGAEAPDAVTDEALMAFKQAVVTALAPVASAVLLDAEFGAARAISTGALPGATGLIVALERSGYEGERTARVSELLPGWDGDRAGQMGASAVKLLVYYHPDAPTAPQTELLVRQVADSCQQADVPFFLEPLSYPLDPTRRRLPPGERRRVVVETARRLTVISGVDVLKAEFPLDIDPQDGTVVPAETEWLAACRELTAASRVPWVLLSAGVGFETYLRQVVVAASAGASGVAVGRAVWREATQLPAGARVGFLSTVAQRRMARTTALCQALARPWTAILGAGVSAESAGDG
jgi:tagatose 1,6-diphosphate aldolase